MMIAGSSELTGLHMLPSLNSRRRTALGRSDVKFAVDQRRSPKIQTDSYLTLSNA